MLFWSRAAICIGTVTVLAIGRLPASPARVPVPAVSGAATLAGEACRSRPALCASVLTGGFGALAHRPELPAAKPDLRRPAGRQSAPVALGRRSLT